MRDKKAEKVMEKLKNKIGYPSGSRGVSREDVLMAHSNLKELLHARARGELNQKGQDELLKDLILPGYLAKYNKSMLK
jgi:hypothetical protein